MKIFFCSFLNSFLYYFITLIIIFYIQSHTKYQNIIIIYFFIKTFFRDHDCFKKKKHSAYNY